MNENNTSLKERINKIAEYIKEQQSGEQTGHDWWHTYRVWKNAKLIMSKFKNIDYEVIELSALLHDIADWKFHGGDDSIGPQKAKKCLEQFNINKDAIEHVCSIIAGMSFKGANVSSNMQTLEGKIVQDADRLDAMGAIGIARAFAYGAYAKQEIYNPEIKPKLHNSYDEYKNSKTTTVNHFYEKLLLLKDKLNTQEAKAIAQERHNYMASFLDRFTQEWEGLK